MSKRFAFIGEGKTDLSVFVSALLALPGGQNCTVIQIQPPFDQIGDPNHQGPLGGGWHGVLEWCQEHSASGDTPLDGNILANYDAVVVHVDADIAVEQELVELCIGKPCPPALGVHEDVAAYIGALLQVNSGHDQRRVVFMLPCQATEAWIIAGLFGDAYSPPPELECLADPAAWLHGKSPRFVRAKDGRIRKVAATYEQQQSTLSTRWHAICQRCVSADEFFSHVSVCL